MEILLNMVEAFGRMPWGGILALGAICFIIRLLEGDFSLRSLRAQKKIIPREDEDEEEWVLVRRKK